MITLHWQHFSRFVLGLCFLKSKKKTMQRSYDNTLRPFKTDLHERYAFRLYHN